MTQVTQADLQSALYLPPKLAIEVLANLTMALVYCETMIWQYRQRWLDYIAGKCGPKARTDSVSSP